MHPNKLFYVPAFWRKERVSNKELILKANKKLA